MSAVAAMILAGGRGERLGRVVKSEIRLGGVRLIERVAGVLAGCAPLLVAHGRLDPGRLGLEADWVPVADLEGDYAGPLAGVAAAVRHLNRGPLPRLLIVAAVDAPFLPVDYVERLVAGLGDADAGVAWSGGQDYPTNSVWRFSAIAGLADAVAAGTAPRSLKRLATRLGALRIDWPADGGGDPFANINTPEELAAAELRAAGKNGLGN